MTSTVPEVRLKHHRLPKFPGQGRPRGKDVPTVCSCGEWSEPLHDKAERRAWHTEHQKKMERDAR